MPKPSLLLLKLRECRAEDIESRADEAELGLNDVVRVLWAVREPSSLFRLRLRAGRLPGGDVDDRGRARSTLRRPRY